MCGQYYCDSSTFSFLEDEEVKMSPGQSIPVLLYFNNKIVITKLRWGYSLLMNKELIINARCETLFDKKIFQNDIRERRCLIPAKGFYQKDINQNRISFESQQHQTIYFAGIYHNNEVVIITTKANDVMRTVHNRMPLMIPQENAYQWLIDGEAYKELLTFQNEDLKIVSGHLQQALFEY
ncbi:MAG: SOS response-associated peptidase [Coprobacillus sp.]|nr:SOS response-associated peptidase [Coprobacillus sp.]